MKITNKVEYRYSDWIDEFGPLGERNKLSKAKLGDACKAFERNFHRWGADIDAALKETQP
jgi:hypothetical protein